MDILNYFHEHYLFHKEDAVPYKIASELYYRGIELEAENERQQKEISLLKMHPQDQLIKIMALEVENERLKKELRDERVARLAEWLEEDRVDKEQFDDAIEELQALGGKEWQLD